MLSKTQSKSSSHTCVITGRIDEDRRYFSEELSQPSYGESRHYTVDMGQISKLDIVTLGLIAWLHENVLHNGHSMEFINTGAEVQRALGMYQLQ